MGSDTGNVPFGVYVHVPYCRKRCSYCDFALTPVDAAPSSAFVDAAIAEIRAWGTRPIAGLDLSGTFERRRAVSLYLGGGTPSMLAPADVARLVEAVDARFGLARGAEVTLEANPEDVTRDLVAGFRVAGVNRLSLGLQSTEDRFLRALGREHDAERAAASVRDAREAGIEDVSIDLIFGVEGMTLADWERVLEQALALAPTHLSCYGLTVERGTALDRAVRAARVDLPPEDDQAAMYEMAVARLGAAGHPRYEISNFAAPARRAVHNSLYWKYAEWIGVGPSAHSFARIGPAASPEAGGVRWWNGKNPFRYLESAGRPIVGGSERVVGRHAMGEMAFTALRTTDGLPDAAFGAAFGTEPAAIFGETFSRLEARGLLVRDSGRTRLTERGFLLSDSIFRDIVGDAD